MTVVITILVLQKIEISWLGNNRHSGLSYI